jgi:hypothetical protein
VSLRSPVSDVEAFEHSAGLVVGAAAGDGAPSLRAATVPEDVQALHVVACPAALAVQGAASAAVAAGGDGSDAAVAAGTVAIGHADAYAVEVSQNEHIGAVTVAGRMTCADGLEHVVAVGTATGSGAAAQRTPRASQLQFPPEYGQHASDGSQG